jgi:D-alanyl-lipoteichoic acid acyltransferase DltB (MBOAT superfamily)
MLFVSGVFLLYFLPTVLIGYRLLSALGRKASLLWLIAASLIFYGYSSPRFVSLLVGSILFNYLLGLALARTRETRLGSVLFWLGLALNLGLLCFYKYLPSITQSLHHNGVIGFQLPDFALPLGISFFTFLQIGYMVDISQGTAEPASLLNYSFFVSFFPHLISGPIVNHKEIMPQLAPERCLRLNADNMLLGFTWFTLGLAKKLLIADRIADVPNAAFSNFQHLDALSAWLGLLMYSMQLYFDFSGYTDMAIGLARIFGFRYPYNFNSPFKATNITDFWKCWHMSLTRFLNGYLYNPISVSINRRRMQSGKVIGRKALSTPSGFFVVLALPTLLTMLAIGIWHGAGLQYALFGLVHGCYLCIYPAWRVMPIRTRVDQLAGRLLRPLSVGLTYLSVIMSFAIFRSESVSAAMHYLADLFGKHGWHSSGHPDAFVLYLLALYPIVWFLPNTQQILGDSPTPLFDRPILSWLRWKPNYAWAIATGLLCLLSLFFAGQTQAFLYFKF